MHSRAGPDGSVAATVLPAAGGLPGEELYPSYDTVGRQKGLSGATVTTTSSSTIWEDLRGEEKTATNHRG